jgi:hypothetical protein
MFRAKKKREKEMARVEFAGGTDRYTNSGSLSLNFSKFLFLFFLWYDMIHYLIVTECITTIF